MEETQVSHPGSDVSTDDEETKKLEEELLAVQKEKEKLKKKAKRKQLREQLERETKKLEELKRDCKKNIEKDTPEVNKKKGDNNSEKMSLKSVSEDSKPHQLKPQPVESDNTHLVLELSKIYDMVQRFVNMEEYDEDLRDELERSCPNFMNDLTASKRDLTRPDCGIVVTGETSAGKTSLINLIIQRKDRFVASNLAATGKVCRIRNSDIMAVKLYTKDDKLIKEETVKGITDLKMLITKYTDISSCPKEFKTAYFVDVFLPVPILQGNVIIVDTPGIGKTKELDNILMDFLPHAVSFIFLINAHNAGGVHEDRLGGILKQIKENKCKMPCFDPKDVLFLTNKWDIISDDDDGAVDENEDAEAVFLDENGDAGSQNEAVGSEERKEHKSEKEKTWFTIKTKLSNCWGEISENKIFRTSLKEVASQKKSYSMDEYLRFRKALEDTIAMNQDKRLKYYFNSLMKFAQNAKRGTLVRVHSLETTEKEQKESVEKHTEKLREIKNDCELKRTHLLEYKEELVSEFAEQLHEYISSDDGKKKILSPEGKLPIMNVSYTELEELIPKRIEEGIKSWCKGEEFKKIMEKAGNKIDLFVVHINQQINDLETVMTGIRVSFNHDLFGIGADNFGMGTLFLGTTTDAFAFVSSVVITPFSILYDKLISSDKRRKMVDSIYSQCLFQISRSQLRTMFEDSFGGKYRRFVLDIFEEKLPKQIAILKTMNETLVEKKSEIMRKKGSFKKLDEVIKEISRATDDFGKTLNSEALSV